MIQYVLAMTRFRAGKLTKIVLLRGRIFSTFLKPTCEKKTSQTFVSYVYVNLHKSKTMTKSLKMMCRSIMLIIVTRFLSSPVHSDYKLKITRKEKNVRKALR